MAHFWLETTPDPSQEEILEELKLKAEYQKQTLTELTSEVDRDQTSGGHAEPIADLQRTVERLEQEAAVRRHMLAEARTKSAEPSQGSVRQIEELNAVLEAAREMLNEQVHGAAQAEKAKAELVLVETERQRLATQLEQQTQEGHKLQARLEELDPQIQAAQALKAEIQRLRADAQARAAFAERQESNIQRLEAQLAERDQTIKEFNAIIKRLDEERAPALAALLQRLQEIARERDELREKIEAMTRTVSTLRRLLQTSSEALMSSQPATTPLPAPRPSPTPEPSGTITPFPGPVPIPVIRIVRPMR